LKDRHYNGQGLIRSLQLKDRHYNGQGLIRSLQLKDRHYNGHDLIRSLQLKDRHYNDQQKKDTRQTMVGKALHRKLKIEQQEPH
jgi:hypothetical protein